MNAAVVSSVPYTVNVPAEIATLFLFAYNASFTILPPLEPPATLRPRMVSAISSAAVAASSELVIQSAASAAASIAPAENVRLDIDPFAREYPVLSDTVPAVTAPPAVMAIEEKFVGKDCVSEYPVLSDTVPAVTAPPTVIARELKLVGKD